MPDIPLVQQIFVYGVIAAMVLFMAVLAFGVIVTRQPASKRAVSARREQSDDHRRHAA